ncbi:MAG TPA: hypothetical protein VLH18_04645 [Candidatus Limnocylindrales bacterium]|nr:hypothetical protein [Candidatus Limnocylindrales bacterium]
MRSEQKTAKTSCPGKGMVETESNKGARSIALLETAEGDAAESLL